MPSFAPGRTLPFMPLAAANRRLTWLQHLTVFLLKPFDAGGAPQACSTAQELDCDLTLLDPNEPVVSVEILSQLRKLMPEPAVRQIYTAVVADLTKRIEALGTAIAKGDTAEVRRIGHAIKGGCGMAGALQAAHLGALLDPRRSIQG